MHGCPPSRPLRDAPHGQTRDLPTCIVQRNAKATNCRPCLRDSRHRAILSRRPLSLPAARTGSPYFQHLGATLTPPRRSTQLAQPALSCRVSRGHHCHVTPRRGHYRAPKRTLLRISHWARNASRSRRRSACVCASIARSCGSFVSAAAKWCCSHFSEGSLSASSPCSLVSARRGRPVGDKLRQPEMSRPRNEFACAAPRTSSHSSPTAGELARLT